jgi:hypothetical protein
METNSTPLKAILTTACVGMGFRPKNILKNMLEDNDVDLHLSIKPEPTNAYNSKAIAVYHCDNHIGYIPDTDLDEAHRFLEFIDQVNVVSCTSFIEKAKLDEQGYPKWLQFGIEVEYI